MPEGMTYDQKFEMAMRGIAHEVGITQAQMKTLVKAFNDYQIGAFNEHITELNRSREEGERALKESWATDYDANVQIAQRALKELVSDEAFIKLIEDSKLGNNPVFVKGWHEIGKKMLNDTYVKSEAQTETKKDDDYKPANPASPEMYMIEAKIPKTRFEGKIPIPVIGQFKGSVHITKDGAYLKDPGGVITWSYSGKSVTGKGIFVVACARSGTVYTAKVLSALGYNIGHEITGPDGSVGYHLAIVKPKNCFHQVRNPIDQISSASTLSSWGIVEKITDIKPYTLLGRMQYWLIWNEMCEEFCVWRYRLEDLPNVWDEFLERIDHKKVPMPDIPTNVNSNREFSRYDKVTWADLFNENAVLAQKIRDKAKQYGYSPERISDAIDESQITVMA
jgi:hypothetical protein